MTHDAFFGFHGAPAGAAVAPGWRRVVEPQSAIEVPVTLAEFAAFIEDPCPPDENTTEATLRTTWLRAATQQVVEYLDRELLPREIVTRFDAYPQAHSSRGQLERIHGGDEFFAVLPRVPVKEFDKVEIVDDEGNASTVDPSEYVLDTVSEPARIHMPHPPRRPELQYFAGIRIYYTAGYESDAIPEPCRLAVMMLAGYLYEHRGAEGDRPMRKSGAASVASQYRIRIGL